MILIKDISWQTNFRFSNTVTCGISKGQLCDEVDKQFAGGFSFKIT